MWEEYRKTMLKILLYCIDLIKDPEVVISDVEGNTLVSWESQEHVLTEDFLQKFASDKPVIVVKRKVWKIFFYTVSIENSVVLEKITNYLRAKRMLKDFKEEDLLMVFREQRNKILSDAVKNWGSKP